MNMDERSDRLTAIVDTLASSVDRLLSRSSVGDAPLFLGAACSEVRRRGEMRKTCGRRREHPDGANHR